MGYVNASGTTVDALDGINFFFVWSDTATAYPVDVMIDNIGFS